MPGVKQDEVSIYTVHEVTKDWREADLLRLAEKVEALSKTEATRQSAGRDAR